MRNYFAYTGYLAIIGIFLALYLLYQYIAPPHKSMFVIFILSLLAWKQNKNQALLR